jgi:hypothetical protein
VVVRLLEALFLVTLVVGSPAAAVLYIRGKNRKPSALENCKHRRWTPWEVVGKTDVHLYSEVDEGKGLPDRVDAQLARTCISCGLPEYKTVRGIDSPHFK